MKMNSHASMGDNLGEDNAEIVTIIFEVIITIAETWSE